MILPQDVVHGNYRATLLWTGRPLTMTFRNPNSAEPTDTSPQPEAGTGGTDRMAALAEAFGMDGRVGGALSAQSAAETFSEATLTLARAQPAFVKEVEAVRPTRPA